MVRRDSHFTENSFYGIVVVVFIGIHKILLSLHVKTLKKYNVVQISE